MKKLDEESRNRSLNRRAVMGIVGAGVAVSVSEFRTRKWIKPVVESVLLPAHATTSEVTDDTPGTLEPPLPGFEVMVVSDFGCGSSIAFGSVLMTTITVSPPPPSGESLAIVIGCGGNESEILLPLDIAGTATIAVEALAFCDPILPVFEPNLPNTETLVLSATFQDSTDSCFWEFEGEVREEMLS